MNDGSKYQATAAQKIVDNNAAGHQRLNSSSKCQMGNLMKASRRMS
jgi:hypothetical protein